LGLKKIRKGWLIKVVEDIHLFVRHADDVDAAITQQIETRCDACGKE
jgi:hypothetical protein